ncbi:unnamed protein product [Closterium sp. NIES-54]
MSLKETLKYERERSAVEKIDLQEEIEKHDNTIATLTAELARLTEALSVSEAWRMPAAPPSANEVAEPGFVDRHTLLEGVAQGAHDMKVRRMLKAMDAVRLLCSSDGDADTKVVVAAVNKITAPDIGTFCDGCPPSPLAPSYAYAAAADVSVAEDVGAASASGKHHSSKGKVGKGGGGGNGGGGGGNGSSGGGSSGGGGGGGSGGGSGGSGGSGTGGGGTGARRAGSGGGHR